MRISYGDKIVYLKLVEKENKSQNIENVNVGVAEMNKTA